MEGRALSRPWTTRRSSLHFLVLPVLLTSICSAAPLKLAESKDRLVFLNTGSWKSGEHEGRKCLILDVPGKQRPPVRRPSEFALLKGDKPVGGFTVEAATLMPKSVKNRDVCLVFGYKDDTHFYYAHISSNSDNKFHNIIMRVDGDSRTRINLEKDPAPRLADGWRTIRIQHSVNGEIKVFVDDMETPNMTAKDITYPVGRIGFGSFDDRAAFSGLVLSGLGHEP